MARAGTYQTGASGAHGVRVNAAWWRDGRVGDWRAYAAALAVGLGMLVVTAIEAQRAMGDGAGRAAGAAGADAVGAARAVARGPGGSPEPPGTRGAGGAQ